MRIASAIIGLAVVVQCSNPTGSSKGRKSSNALPSRSNPLPADSHWDGQWEKVELRKSSRSERGKKDIEKSEWTNASSGAKEQEKRAAKKRKEESSSGSSGNEDEEWYDVKIKRKAEKDRKLRKKKTEKEVVLEGKKERTSGLVWEDVRSPNEEDVKSSSKREGEWFEVSSKHQRSARDAVFLKGDLQEQIRQLVHEEVDKIMDLVMTKVKQNLGEAVINQFLHEEPVSEVVTKKPEVPASVEVEIEREGGAGPVNEEQAPVLFPTEPTIEQQQATEEVAFYD